MYSLRHAVHAFCAASRFPVAPSFLELWLRVFHGLFIALPTSGQEMNSSESDIFSKERERGLWLKEAWRTRKKCPNIRIA